MNDELKMNDNAMAQYDPSKVKLPKTDFAFWFALLRIRNHYIAEAMTQHAAGEPNFDHIWHTWLLLDFWLDKAFAYWRLGDRD